MKGSNQDGNPYDQQQGSRGPEDRNDPAAQLAEILKGIKEIENAKKGDKSVPEQMAPDKANSTILMLGAMALLIAGAVALPAGAEAIPFLGIMAGLVGAMSVKNMAEMLGITLGENNERKIDNQLDNAKIKAIENAITELGKKNYIGSSPSPDSSQPLKPGASTSQMRRGSEYNQEELVNALKEIVSNIGSQSREQPAQNYDRFQPSQRLEQGGENSHRKTGWSGGGGADSDPYNSQQEATKRRLLAGQRQGAGHGGGAR